MAIEYLPPPKPEKEPGRKSKSQRLRAVLFLCWEQDNEGFEDSESYYRFHLEKIIQHYQSKLPNP